MHVCISSFLPYVVLCSIEERWKFITRGYQDFYFFFVLLQIFKILYNFSVIMKKNIRQQKKMYLPYNEPLFCLGVSQHSERRPDLSPCLSPTCCSFSYPISGGIIEFLPSLPHTISSYRVLSVLHSVPPAALGAIPHTAVSFCQHLSILHHHPCGPSLCPADLSSILLPKRSVYTQA